MKPLLLKDQGNLQPWCGIWFVLLAWHLRDIIFVISFCWFFFFSFQLEGEGGVGLEGEEGGLGLAGGLL